MRFKGLVALGLLASLATEANGQAKFPAFTTWGNPTAGPALPKTMSQLEFTSLCNVFTSALVGCTPASGGGATKVLRSDGVWATQTQLTALVNLVTSSLSGAIPAFPNTTTSYFRGDGTYQTLNFAAIQSTPTTLAGYGITSPLPIAQGGVNCTVASGTCLDNITGFSSTGFVERTGAGTYVFTAAPLPGSKGGTGNAFFQVSGPATSTKTYTFPNSSQAVAMLDLADQTVSGGANVTTLGLSTGNITVDCGARPIQTITNGGAFTITAPVNPGYCVLDVTNNASAGAITFSGFSVGANTGDTLTTTNTNAFLIFIYKSATKATYSVKAFQ